MAGVLQLEFAGHTSQLSVLFFSCMYLMGRNTLRGRMGSDKVGGAGWVGRENTFRTLLRLSPPLFAHALGLASSAKLKSHHRRQRAVRTLMVTRRRLPRSDCALLA